MQHDCSNFKSLRGSYFQFETFQHNRIRFPRMLYLIYVCVVCARVPAQETQATKHFKLWNQSRSEIQCKLVKFHIGKKDYREWSTCFFKRIYSISDSHMSLAVQCTLWPFSVSTERRNMIFWWQIRNHVHTKCLIP